MARGVFIALEGIDGSGTTTQARRLTARLARLGLPTLLTKEPSKGRVGRLIDRVIASKQGRDRRSLEFHETVALLFAADRLDHVETEVDPALRRGCIVVSDRFVMSSWAYQSVKLDPDWVRVINSQAKAPDLTILLDAPASLCLRRIGGRPQQHQVFERESFLQRVRANYRLLARQEKAKGARIAVVHAAPPAGLVAGKVWECVEPVLRELHLLQREPLG